MYIEEIHNKATESFSHFQKVVDDFCSSCEEYVYGVATVSRLLKIIGLFCKMYSLLQGSFAKET